ncbi:META domain-containing protein, partial [Acinetobacter baumannii]
MKIQRLRKKNSIDIARKLPLKCLFIAISLVLAACQSTPQPNNHKGQVKPTHRVQTPVVKKKVSPDGVQDIDWQITQINGHKAKFFNQWPTLSLNSTVKTVTGHTGCN